MTDFINQDFWTLAAALGIGLLIGMERERTDSIAGVRTFALVAVLGCLSAQTMDPPNLWLVAAGLIAVAALLVARIAMLGADEAGLTTVIAVLVVYVLSAALGTGRTTLAVVAGGLAFLLLRWKQPLHRFVEQIGERDVAAVATLALVSMVILPVLPNTPVGWFDAINPFQTWLMVVLIVALNFAGYLCLRFVGGAGQSLLAGLMGGMVSSTATTVAAASRAAGGDISVRAAVAIVMLASSVVYLRILVLVMVVAPTLGSRLLAPTLVMFVTSLAVGLVLTHRAAGEDTGEFEEAGNPAHLGAALTFGALYAAISLAVAGAEARLGEDAVYLVAALSGLADVDALTLSTSQFARAGRLAADLSWRVILIGSLSNLLFKVTAAGALGGRRLALELAAPAAIVFVIGTLVIAMWP